MRRTSKAGTEGAARAPRAGERGYTYASALVILVGVSLAAQTTAIPGQSARLRNMEAELIFRGLAYMAAIEAHRADAGPPADLAALLRVPDGARYIRRLYPDPVTGREWTLLRDASGGITGVASSSRAAPRKRAFFPEGLEHFRDAESYADWTFEAPGS